MKIDGACIYVLNCYHMTEEPFIESQWRWMKRYKKVSSNGYKGFGRSGREGTKLSQPGSTLGAPASMKG